MTPKQTVLARHPFAHCQWAPRSGVWGVYSPCTVLATGSNPREAWRRATEEPYVARVKRLALALTNPQVRLLGLLYAWRGEFPGPRHLTGREGVTSRCLRAKGLIHGIRSLTELGTHVYRELGWVGRD